LASKGNCSSAILLQDIAAVLLSLLVENSFELNLALPFSSSYYFYLSIGLCIGLLYQHLMIDGEDCGAVSSMNEWQEKPEYSETTCLSSALSTRDLK
jgi:hypothetical protein